MEGTQGEKCNDHIRSLRSSMEHGACASKVGSLHQPRWKRSGTLAGWSVNAAELGQVTFRKRLLRVTTKYHNKDTCKITQAFLPLESDTIRALFFETGSDDNTTHQEGGNFLNRCTMWQCSFSASSEAHEPHEPLYTSVHPLRTTTCVATGARLTGPGARRIWGAFGAWSLAIKGWSKNIYIYIWTSWSCKKVSRKFQEQWRADLFHTNC